MENYEIFGEKKKDQNMRTFLSFFLGCFALPVVSYVVLLYVCSEMKKKKTEKLLKRK